jgi:hypothetical protein
MLAEAHLPPAVSNASQGGGVNLSPPLAIQTQIRVAPAHLFPIVRRIDVFMPKFCFLRIDSKEASSRNAVAQDTILGS